MSNNITSDIIEDDESLIIDTYHDSYFLRLIYDKIPNFFRPYLGSFSVVFTCLFFLGIL